MAGILFVCHIICTFARKTEKGVKVFLRVGFLIADIKISRIKNPERGPI